MKIWISALLGGLMLVGSAMAQSADKPQDKPSDRPAWGTAKQGKGSGDAQQGRRGTRARWGQDMTPEQRKEWQERGKKMRNMMMMSRALTFAIDTDQDGELSKKEIANIVANLKKLDKNKDGKLTAEELSKAIPEDMQWGRGPGGRGPGGRGPGGRGPGGRGPAGTQDKKQDTKKEVPTYRPID